jgi:molybdopterin-guanine dinucleotide biosynthesis protein A
MGRDKALIEVDGRPLARIAAAALEDAGASEVLAVGGDESALTRLGLRWVPDRWPREGPLGGLVTALGEAGAEVVVVLSCDLPAVTAEAVRAVLAGLAEGTDASVALAGGRRQPLLAAYRRGCRTELEAAFAAGERALHRALGPLTVAEIPLAEPSWAADVDTPDDLA